MNQRGFSLLELLMGITVGTILAVGATKMSVLATHASFLFSRDLHIGTETSEVLRKVELNLSKRDAPVTFSAAPKANCPPLLTCYDSMTVTMLNTTEAIPTTKSVRFKSQCAPVPGELAKSAEGYCCPAGEAPVVHVTTTPDITKPTFKVVERFPRPGSGEWMGLCFQPDQLSNPTKVTVLEMGLYKINSDLMRRFKTKTLPLDPSNGVQILSIIHY